MITVRKLKELLANKPDEALLSFDYEYVDDDEFPYFVISEHTEYGDVDSRIYLK